MKVLILGGHGFVGKAIAESLKKTEHDVFVLSRRDGLDLTDFSCTKDHFVRIMPEAIINCAAHVGGIHYVSSFAADVVHDNVLMTLNIYKTVKEVCAKTMIINPLANCCYPAEVDVCYESNWMNGEVHDSVFSYGNCKRFEYVVSKNYNKQYNIKSKNFIVPNTFGPGDYTDPNIVHAINGMIIRMIKAKRQGDKVFEIWGTGKPIREWGYIKDVAAILIKGLTVEDDLIYPINMAQKKGYSIKDSAELIAEIIGFDGELVYNTKYQDGAPIKIMDNGRFKMIFPDFQFYDHKRGIQDTVEYYEKEL